MSTPIKNGDEWLRGGILRVLEEDVANDGFDFVSLARFVGEATKNEFWLNLPSEMRIKLVRKACTHLTRKGTDIVFVKKHGCHHIRIDRKSYQPELRYRHAGK